MEKLQTLKVAKPANIKAIRKNSQKGKKQVRKAFAIVHHATGNFPNTSGVIPIYFFKKDAEQNLPPGDAYIVQPILWDAFIRLVLSHPNKKAR